MISKDSMDYLFDTLKFYGEQYDKIADHCYEDVLNALNEIARDFLPAKTEVMPYGSYHIKSNYQLVEPMEFYVVLHGDKEKILSREAQQRQENLNYKKHKKNSSSSIKNVYQNILSGSSNQEQVVTSFDVAKTIMNQMQKYLGEDDVVYFKNNVVFVRFHTKDELQILAVISVVYEFEDGLFEFKKYGLSTAEYSQDIIKNILTKNNQTNGNYILLCKLIKMLELELVLTEMSTKYLSKKSLFVEHLLYNVPNKLFEGNDFCQIFVNIVNFVKHCEIDDLYLADNKTKMFVEDGYYANQEFKSFIKKIVFLSKNTNQMIEDAIKKYSNKNDENQSQTNNNQLATQNDKKFKKLGK